MEALSKINFLQADQIKTDSDFLESHGRDWTRFWPAKPSAILFPKTTEEVQKIVLWANENKIKIVPSGGRTGLSGGAVASHGEVVLSLDKMTKISNLNTTDLTVECEAGVITEVLQNFVKEKGYYFPVDFAARGSSQIGGNIATNAGGIKVIKYGMMRDWIAGLTVVTGKGEILHLNNGLIKNNTGYDFRHLFIGSEGTLGIITECLLKFTHSPKEQSTILLGLPDVDAIMPVYENFMQNLSLTAFEMFTDKALHYVKKASSMENPLTEDCPIYLVVEIENENDTTEEELMKCFEYCMEEGWVIDGAISQSETQTEEFWKYRELVAEAVAFAPPHKNDVSVSISKVPRFFNELINTYGEKYPSFEVVIFGHIGDGNLHVNILKPSDMDLEHFLNECHKVDEIMFKKVQELQGSVSAEHGVGLVKKDPLHYTRSEQEIELMKGIKKVFDPNLILNPGKMFDY